MRSGRLPLLIGKVTPLLQFDGIGVAVADNTTGMTT